jgi:hypothetical protein
VIDSGSTGGRTDRTGWVAWAPAVGVTGVGGSAGGAGDALRGPNAISRRCGCSPRIRRTTRRAASTTSRTPALPVSHRVMVP